MPDPWKRSAWWPSRIARNANNAVIVYLDLKDWINLARNAQHLSVPPGYNDLLTSARAALADEAAVFPLSATHYVEMSGITDPRQRRDVATVMEELSSFRVLLGRGTVMRLEIESALDKAGARSTDEPVVLPLLGGSAGWAFGKRGGLRVQHSDGNDITEEVRDEEWYRTATQEVERRLLAGPSDDEAEVLRRD